MEEKNQETVIDKVENRMVKFSIIVPVYKVEAYLDRCVDSLIHQTIDPEQLEILLVDDGSPDRCGALCDQYAEQYPFVKALHKENGGLSSARNYGVERASGEWIIFVDSDDYVEKDLCEVLKKEIRKYPALDTIVYNGLEEENGEASPVRRRPMTGSPVNGKEYLLQHYKTRSLSVEAWLYAYRRDFLHKNHLQFKEEILHEDVEFTPRAMLQAEQVLELDQPLYHYIIRENSISTAKNMQKNIRDLYQTLEQQVRMAEHQPPELQKWMKNAALDSYLNMVQTARMYQKKYRPLLKKQFLRGKAATPWNHFRVLVCTCNVRLYCLMNDSYKKLRG